MTNFEKIKKVLVILFLFLACIAFCQKAILQNSISENINYQIEINDKLSEFLENYEVGE